MAAQLNVLQDRKAALLAHAKQINKLAADEGRAALSTEEQTAYDADMAEVQSVNAALKREQQLQALEKELATVPDRGAPDRDQVDALNGKKHLNAADRIDFEMLSEPKHFKGPKARENAFKSGKWMQGKLFGNQQSLQWCKDYAPEMLATSTGQGEFINSAGGVLVASPISDTVITLREKYGIFRQNVKVWPLGSETISIPRRTGGLTAYWVAENNDTTASQKTWDSITLVAKELASLVRYPNTLAQDAVIMLADDLSSEIAYAFAKEEDTAGFTGDGSAAHGGILGVVNRFATGNYAGGVFTPAAGHSAFSTLTLADFNGLMGLIPQYAREGGNCKWYVSQAGFAASMERLMFAGGGNNVSNIMGGTGPSFLGYPVVISQVLNTTLTAQTSTYGLALFGDLGMAAAMGDRAGISISSSSDRYFEFRQVGIQGVERVDVNVHDTGSASVAGPIVCLQASTS